MRASSTDFAPAERLSCDGVLKQCQKLAKLEHLSEISDSFPDPVVILNRQRQILFANAAYRAVARRTLEELIGQRSGEVIGCINAHAHRGGCGTSRACEFCGAIQAVLATQVRSEQVSKECRITLEGQAITLEFLVTATPLSVDGETFTTVVLKDLSAASRRDWLERLFFHDVLNTAFGLQSLSMVIADPATPPQQKTEHGALLRRLMDGLIAEIEDQRRLLLAERGELIPQLAGVRVVDIMSQVEQLYRNCQTAPDRKLVVNRPPDVTVVTDPALLRRVLGNLVKNALEATPVGGAVTFACTEMPGALVFSIHNPGVMSDAVRVQVFQRSFSTKGEPGRGIGCYSVKLLGEQYLGGSVWFESVEPDGTTFRFMLPTG